VPGDTPRSEGQAAGISSFSMDSDDNPIGVTTAETAFVRDSVAAALLLQAAGSSSSDELSAPDMPSQNDDSSPISESFDNMIKLHAVRAQMLGNRSLLFCPTETGVKNPEFSESVESMRNGSWSDMHDTSMGHGLGPLEIGASLHGIDGDMLASDCPSSDASCQTSDNSATADSAIQHATGRVASASSN